MASSLSEVLRLQELKLQRIVFENDRKGQVTCVASCRSGGGLVVVKHRKWPTTEFEAEKNYYSANDGAFYLPKLVAMGEDYLTIEHHHSMTLKEFLEDSPTDDEVRRVLDAVGRFVQTAYDLSAAYIDDEAADAITGNYGRLLVSGQMLQKRSELENFVAAAFLKVTAPLFRRRLPRFGRVHGQPIHGDLHLNNILVLPDYTIRVIDWETTRHSSPLVDLTYLIPMLEKKAHLPVSVLPLGLEKKLRPAMAWLSMAVRSNRKF